MSWRANSRKDVLCNKMMDCSVKAASAKGRRQWKWMETMAREQSKQSKASDSKYGMSNYKGRNASPKLPFWDLGGASPFTPKFARDVASTSLSIRSALSRQHNVVDTLGLVKVQDPDRVIMKLAHCHIVLLLLPLVTARLAVWPQPKLWRSAEGVLWLDPKFHALLKCGNDSQAPGTADREHQDALLLNQGQPREEVIGYASQFTQNQTMGIMSEQRILRDAVRAFIEGLQTSKFVPWKFHRRGSTFEPSADAVQGSIVTLKVNQETCPSPTFVPDDFFGGDESYEINIDAEGAQIFSRSTIGTMRAFGKSVNFSSSG
jgi:hypothetical protein